MMKYFSVFMIFALVSFSVVSSEKGTAEANKVEGLYVFTDCEPTNEYEVLGEVAPTWALDSKYVTVRDEIVRRTKKKHKDAEGVILYITGAELSYKAAAIKFK